MDAARPREVLRECEICELCVIELDRLQCLPEDGSHVLNSVFMQPM